MDKMYKIAMLILVVIIFVSFFLPWVSVESAAVGSVSKLLTGKEQAKIDSISGFKVPIIANSEESRFMISVIKIFNPNITNADKKSWLIWLVPGLSLIFLALGHFLGKNKWFYLCVGILGVLIFSGATFKIFTTDLDKLVLQINIGIGLWILLISYLGIGVINLMRFVNLIRQK